MHGAILLRKSPLSLRWQGREAASAASALLRGAAELHTVAVAVRTNVYVDGFNLYYGAVKGTPYKWLDIRRCCDLAFPRNEIHEIHYCTAIVKDAPWASYVKAVGEPRASVLSGGQWPAGFSQPSRTGARQSVPTVFEPSTQGPSSGWANFACCSFS